jgi:hypothetical protein
MDVFRLLMIGLAVGLLCLAVAGCSSGDDDDDDDDDAADDDTADDDTADDDTADDDTVDDDTGDDDDTPVAEPYRGWQRPCDVDGLPGVEILATGGHAQWLGDFELFAWLLDDAGRIVGTYDATGDFPPGTNWLHGQLADFDADGRCEILVHEFWEGETWNDRAERVLVLKGGDFQKVFDTGWQPAEMTLDTSLDINGGGLDLTIATTTRTARPLELRAFDGADGFRELLTLEDADTTCELRLVGRRHETGAAVGACQGAGGPAFLLEKVPRNHGYSGEWTGWWITPDGEKLTQLPTIQAMGGEDISTGVMPLADGGCAAFVAVRDEAAGKNGFYLFDRSGATIAQATPTMAYGWLGRADADVDADGAADVVLWSVAETVVASVWVGPAAEKFALREVASTREPNHLEPVFWLTEPWLWSGADFGDGEANFLIGPFLERDGPERNLIWRAFGPDLTPAGPIMRLPVPLRMFYLGKALSLLDPDGTPYAVMHATTASILGAKGPSYIIEYHVGAFRAGTTAPQLLTPPTTQYLTLGEPWDVDGDDRVDTWIMVDHGPRIHFVGVGAGLGELLVTDPQMYEVHGQWY